MSLHASKEVLVYGAAQVYERLGLEINGGACAHSVPPPDLIWKPKKRGLGLPPTITERTEPVNELEDDMVIRPYGKDVPKTDSFAMFVPPQSPRHKMVEVLARWNGNTSYAPIVRQGNYVMIGYSALPRHWSDGYEQVFRMVARDSHGRGREPFTIADWPITLPGKHEFVLPDEGQLVREFYFKFAKPTQLTLRLEHSDSRSMMMVFTQDKGRLHWTRKDAYGGEDLEMAFEITAGDLETVGDGYWKLRIANFDGSKPSPCKLHIDYADERSPTLDDAN